jgi:biopolymer transport protein ExbD
MPKHKPARNSPSLDMTAMCDVAFLLLTFFMLTAKMKPTEAVIVDSPSSISQTKLPDSGTLTILVGKDGKVYVDMVGQHTRKELIHSMNAQYQLGLTEEDEVKFALAAGIGVKREQLRQYLRTEPSQRSKLVVPGVPSDSVDNELGPWIHNARLAQFKMKQEGRVEEEYVIVVKADKDTPYPAVQKVINTLTDVNVHKFNLITNTEADPAKLDGASEM